MAQFTIIKADSFVFTGDKIRIDVSESFLTPDETFATVSHEVSIDAGVTWFNVSSKKIMDWIFSTAGNKTITARISSTTGSSTATTTISVIDITTAKLFSKDMDLYMYEQDIDAILPKRWSSWNVIHHAAQKWILDWLDEKRVVDQDGNKYTIDDFLDPQEVKQLSCYKALEFIYESNSNLSGDISSIKRDKYRALANEKASRAQLKLDYNKNNASEITERTDLLTVMVNRG
jgi:hypothetical protein